MQLFTLVWLLVMQAADETVWELADFVEQAPKTNATPTKRVVIVRVPCFDGDVLFATVKSTASGKLVAALAQKLFNKKETKVSGFGRCCTSRVLLGADVVTFLGCAPCRKASWCC